MYVELAYQEEKLRNGLFLVSYFVTDMGPINRRSHSPVCDFLGASLNRPQCSQPILRQTQSRIYRQTGIAQENLEPCSVSHA